LEQTAAQELKLGASFGSWWSALSFFSTQNEFSSSSAMIQSSNQTSTKAMVRFRADSLGPATFNAELFKQILLAHKETWHIIDRGDTKNLVPVWEILLRRYPEKQKAADLLRETWTRHAQLELDSWDDLHFNPESYQFRLSSLGREFSRMDLDEVDDVLTN
jgi:hypothetical protein